MLPNLTTGSSVNKRVNIRNIDCKFHNNCEDIRDTKLEYLARMKRLKLLQEEEYIDSDYCDNLTKLLSSDYKRLFGENQDFPASKYFTNVRVKHTKGNSQQKSKGKELYKGKY